MSRFPLALFCVALAGAQSSAATLDVRISTETVPAGSTAQVKVYLAAPQPISSGTLIFAFSSAGRDLDSQNPVQAATVFSAAGDVSAVANAGSGGLFSVLFVSPSAGVGRLPGVPILEFSMRAGPGYTITLASFSSFSGPAGTYAMTTSPGGIVIGGTLSVQSVTPGAGGLLPAGTILTIAGTGFQTGGSVRIDGVSVSSAVIASPSLIQVTLGGAAELTAKRIVITNPDGGQITYWGGLGTGMFTLPLPATYSAVVGRTGPPFEDPNGLLLQNPNPVPAQVTITGVSPADSHTVTVPAGGSYRTFLSDPPYATVKTDPATPVRILAFVLSSGSFDPLTILNVVSQAPAIPAIGSVVSGASQASAAVSPGEIVTIHGVNLGPAAPASFTVDSPGNVGRQLNGVQVLFNGIPAPLLYSSASQINAAVPYEIFPYPVSSVQVEYNGAISAGWDIPVSASAPALFTLSGTGQGSAAVLNQDNSINSPTNPAPAGSVLQIYATGEGVTSPVATTGVVVPTGSLRTTLLPVTVAVGGENALVIYDGSAPDSVAGLFQVNVRLPSDLPSGPSIPITLKVGSGVSQAAVTVAIQ